MHKKVLPILAFVLVCFALSGCGASHADKKQANVLGIVKFEEAAYTNSGKTTFAMSSDEVLPRENFSGDKVTLFWGLVTLKDY